MKFTLDWEKWRCGINSAMKLGEGNTALLNDKGYQCCIGQFEEQLGISRESLLDFSEPCELDGDHPDPFVVRFEDDEGDGKNSDLGHDLIEINDALNTNPWEKVRRIRARLEEAGHELEVLNMPPEPEDT